MKHLHLFFFVLLIAVIKAGVTSPFIHDPSRIIKEGSKYFAYSTGNNLPMLYSTDMITWVSGKEVLPNGTPEWARKEIPGNNGHDIWAPDLIFYNGLYYLYYAISGGTTEAIALLTSPSVDPSNPRYNWTDRGPVVMSLPTDQFSSIDPCPYFDAEGNMWLSWGSGYIFPATTPQIFEVRLNKETGLRSDDNKYAVEDGHIEASYVYYKAPYYYLFWNSGGCCDGNKSTYEIHVARSTAVTGPYTEKTPIFYASAANLHGPGQIGIYDVGNSTSYFSYHYYTDKSACLLGINELTWADEWPVPGKPL